MVVSIWRFSHFLLALISTSFLMLISVSGALLALEPIGVTAQPYNTIDLDEVFISETITSLTKDLVFTLGFLLPYQREVILWFTRKFVQNFC